MPGSLLIGILIALLLLIALLAIPVTLSHHISWKQRFHGTLTLRWFFGLVRINFSPFQTSRKKKQSPDRVHSKPEKKKYKSGKNLNVFAAIRQKAFRQRIMKFIADLWHAVHKENISLRLCIGLGDPADTGRLWAIMGPVAGILATSQEASIEIIPDFIDTKLEVDSSGAVRIIPLQIIVLAIGCLLSPPILKGLKQMRTA